MGKEKEEKIAVALVYDPNESAPTVIATGKGVLAEKIIDKAEEEKIPVYEDDTLAKTLSKLELGEAIPQELYKIVAEILVFVDRADKIRERL